MYQVLMHHVHRQHSNKLESVDHLLWLKQNNMDHYKSINLNYSEIRLNEEKESGKKLPMAIQLFLFNVRK